MRGKLFVQLMAIALERKRQRLMKEGVKVCGK